MNIVQGISRQRDIFCEKVYMLLEMLKFDDNTYQHSLNVAKLAKRLNRFLGTDIDDKIMYYSGLFHDIGKMRIDINILNKESNLQANEFDIMKKHSKLGYSILKKNLLPKEIQHSAFYHHERWDGNGYPIRLKGEEIPIAARIISICDVYDALTSDRPYRKAFGEDEAVSMMESFKGQFDEKLLKVFINNLDSIVDR